ncbi:MAG: SGNH/GDSL hydrolase family protein [Mycobacteriales bacterium]
MTLSLVVVGNSIAAVSAPSGAERPGGSFGVAACTALAERGVPARLTLQARWFGFARDAVRDYETAVRPHAPDVLVVCFGTNEAQPWLVPVPLLRHLLDPRRSDRSPLWRIVRSYRRWASPVVGTRTWQARPGRFARDLGQLVSTVRAEFRPLVLVLDLAPPGPVLEHFLPGMAPRHAVVQRVLAQVVGEADDPDVRLVRASGVVDELGMAAALPDGMHYSPAAHRRIGDLIAGEVAEWVGSAVLSGGGQLSDRPPHP